MLRGTIPTSRGVAGPWRRRPPPVLSLPSRPLQAVIGSSGHVQHACSAQQDKWFGPLHATKKQAGRHYGRYNLFSGAGLTVGQARAIFRLTNETSNLWIEYILLCYRICYFFSRLKICFLAIEIFVVAIVITVWSAAY